MQQAPEPCGGTLYVVATPIGNLGDMGRRARLILAGVDFIAAEDTRHSAHLLKAFDIITPLIALHEHNETARAPALAGRIKHGQSAALITDAGTPLVSDPGYRLVRAVQDAGANVRAVPGPSAVLAALSVSGLPSDRFAFEGFMPPRTAARRKRLTEMTADPRTLIFFEAPHRLESMLADCTETFGGAREAALVRELTKLHESVHRGALRDLYHKVAAGDEPARGECVVLVAGSESRRTADAATLDSDTLLAALIGEGISPRPAAAVARRLFPDAKRRDLYQRALELHAH